MERRRKRGYKEKRDRGKEGGMEGGKEGKKEGGREGRKKERKVGKGKGTAEAGAVRCCDDTGWGAGRERGAGVLWGGASGG